MKLILDIDTSRCSYKWDLHCPVCADGERCMLLEIPCGGEYKTRSRICPLISFPFTSKTEATTELKGKK